MSKSSHNPDKRPSVTASSLSGINVNQGCIITCCQTNSDQDIYEPEKGMCSNAHKRFILFFAFIVLFSDKILLTLIVPIFPNILWLNEVVPVIKKHCAIKSVPLINNTHLWRSNCIEALFNMTDIKEIINSQNTKNSVLFAMKAVVQLAFNPLVGFLTNRVGYSIPIFSGLWVMFISCILFAVGNSFPIFMIARCLHGIGASLSVVSSKGILVASFTDKMDRFRAVGCALSGSAVGVFAGPFIAGIIYNFTRKEIPFIIMAVLFLILIALQLVFLKPEMYPETKESVSIFTLLVDPYIFVTTVLSVIGFLGIAALESSLPLWMKVTMATSRLDESILFLAATIAALISVNLYSQIAVRVSHWIILLVSLPIVGATMIGLTFTRVFVETPLPFVVFGFTTGLVNVCVMVVMAWLVDMRYVSVYGSAYAIHDIGVSLAFIIGPGFSGILVKFLNFEWMTRIVAIVIMVSSLLCIFLRNPSPKERETMEYTEISSQSEFSGIQSSVNSQFQSSTTTCSRYE